MARPNPPGSAQKSRPPSSAPHSGARGPEDYQRYLRIAGVALVVIIAAVGVVRMLDVAPAEEPVTGPSVVKQAVEGPESASPVETPTAALPSEAEAEIGGQVDSGAEGEPVVELPRYMLPDPESPEHVPDPPALKTSGSVRGSH